MNAIKKKGVIDRKNKYRTIQSFRFSCTVRDRCAKLWSVNIVNGQTNKMFCRSPVVAGRYEGRYGCVLPFVHGRWQIQRQIRLLEVDREADTITDGPCEIKGPFGLIWQIGRQMATE